MAAKKAGECVVHSLLAFILLNEQPGFVQLLPKIENHTKIKIKLNAKLTLHRIHCTDRRCSTMGQVLEDQRILNGKLPSDFVGIPQ